MTFASRGGVNWMNARAEKIKSSDESNMLPVRTRLELWCYHGDTRRALYAGTEMEEREIMQIGARIKRDWEVQIRV